MYVLILIYIYILMVMGRFIDCQIAIVSWGARAYFKRARVGLLRKGSSSIYIVIYTNSKQSPLKIPVNQNSIEVLPAAIRLKEMQQDLFIKYPSDDQRYVTLLREIKVILNRDKLKQGSRADKLDKFIADIPTFDAFKERDLIPGPRSCRLLGRPQGIDGDFDEYNSLNGSINNNDLEFGDSKPKQVSNDGFHVHGCSFSDGMDGHCPSKASLKRISNAQYNNLSADQDNRYKRLNNKELKCIKISGLDRLPKQLWHRTTLSELTLTDCNLTSVPKQLNTFSSTLISLDLSNNRIDKLPRVFCCKMNQLRFLNLSHNQIETLPIEIKFFSRLVHLNIENNRLRMLPSTFSDLRSLRNLNVANNNLFQLPAFRKEEIRLKCLDISHNPLDGASNEINTFEVHPSYDGPIGYDENLFCPMTSPKKKHFPKLFELSMLRIVRCDKLLKLASEESLPRSIVTTMQRDIFKCYRCGKMNILPAYNSTDVLDYVDQVEQLMTSSHLRHRMTFMKLLCRGCFDKMSS